MEECRWCGQTHGKFCPYVKAFEFAKDGVTVRRVEFFSPNEYPQGGGAVQEQDYPRKPAAEV